MENLSRRAVIGLGLVVAPTTRAAFAQGERTKLVLPTLELAIAVPIYEDIRPITIGPSRHFHVVIANRSERLLRLWDDHCLEGESNLSFEAYENDELKLIRRIGQVWKKNFPIAVELQPGDPYVLNVSFDPGGWELPWADSEIKTRRVRMRASYQNETSESKGKKEIWTGKVASRYDNYIIRDNRR